MKEEQLVQLLRYLVGVAIVGLFTWTYTMSNRLTRVEAFQEDVKEDIEEVNQDVDDIREHIYKK